MTFVLFSSLLLSAPADLAYGSGALDLAKLKSVPDATLQQQVLACAKGYKVEQILRDTTVLWSKSDPATDTLASVTRPERIALLSILGRKMVGSEVDVLAPDGDGFVPVSVYWDSEAKVLIKTGAAVKELLTPTTADALKKTYGVGELIDGDQKWDPLAYAAVGQALATLNQAELALVKGLPFRRMKNGGQHRALYQRGDDSNWVNVFDQAFLFDKEQFMGSVDAPKSDSAGVVLHEIGHAISDARMREAGIANKVLSDDYNKRKGEPGSDDRFKKADAAVRKLLAVDAANKGPGRPAERALAAVLDPKKSPTPYGKKSANESFAECFRIYKLDPDAMKRVSAAAHDWFKSGAYVQIAAKPLD
ncbi:MAG: hypothetical protein IT381_28630 [Deltaproteobacteria bacterium]|nr:hypothetical protein [Deltaproteobacteria bacterium]